MYDVHKDDPWPDVKTSLNSIYNALNGEGGVTCIGVSGRRTTPKFIEHCRDAANATHSSRLKTTLVVDF